MKIHLLDQSKIKTYKYRSWVRILKSWLQDKVPSYSSGLANRSVGDSFLKWKKKRIFELIAKETIFDYLSRNWEIGKNSKLPRQQTRWDLVEVMPIISLLRNFVRVVQFKVHSCFRIEVHPRNPHTVIPKLALVNTVKTPVARVCTG